MTRSEFDLIAAFRERLPAAGGRVVVGSGDDAAVVRAGGSHSVMSVDTTVDGFHARLDLGDPRDSARAFGWRALTTALSDLAAMGVGTPGASRSTEQPRDGSPACAIEAYAALTLPRSFPDDLALALAEGLGDAAARYGVSVVGGDVTAGPAVALSITVVGWADSGASGEPAVLRRSGARTGDLIGLTGPLGAAGAGLALLLGEVDPASLPGQDPEHLLRAYLRPEPHLAQGAALLAAGATAAIDVSDGVVQDARHVSTASAVELRLDLTAIPVAAGVEPVALQAGHDPAWFAATAGEDFVLLATVPPAQREAAEAAGITAWVGTVHGGGTSAGAPDASSAP
ncbi:MAG: thiamine-phosphate kinase, partial [Solirubrobacteraceae bacterium]|nr:thiamine-phosphate kinase [Solirubrobacteraceae bacterium]